MGAWRKTPHIYNIYNSSTLQGKRAPGRFLTRNLLDVMMKTANTPDRN
jgi:hypothetical protein